MNVFQAMARKKISNALRHGMRNSILFLLFFFSLNAQGFSGFARATVMEFASQSLDGVGDPCDDGDPCTLMDVIQPDNTCAGFTDPNDAFTLTPSAEKVCGEDSAYFTITGPALAVVNYSLNDEFFLIALDEQGEGVIGVVTPIDDCGIYVDTIAVELMSYETTGGINCNAELLIRDTLINHSGFLPYLSNINYDNECSPFPGNDFGDYSAEITSPEGSIVYFHTNYPSSPFSGAYGTDFAIGSVNCSQNISFDLEDIAQNTDFIITLDSIDYYGCVAEVNNVADTVRIPSWNFTLYYDMSTSFYSWPQGNDGIYRNCYYFELNTIPLIAFGVYTYENPPIGGLAESYEYIPAGLLDSDFEFEINGVPVHFNNFQTVDNSYINSPASAVSLDGVEYVLELGTEEDQGPRLSVVYPSDLVVYNDTIQVRVIAATGPDGCRRTGVFTADPWGTDIRTTIVNPFEILLPDTTSLMCGSLGADLIGFPVQDVSNANSYYWTNEPITVNPYIYSTYGGYDDTLTVIEPGIYTLISRSSNCEVYMQEFAVFAETGTSCDDGNPCTINDVYDADCVCAGTYVDTDGDGACDSLEVAGCTDLAACNYSALATESNGSCVFPGCSDAMACNYDMSAGCDDGSCTYAGCTDQTACNYNLNAGCDDGTCIFGGCTDVQACNYNANAACEDGSCIPSGCTDDQACNYNPAAGCDNGDCQYLESFTINGNQQPVEFGESQYSYTQTTGSAYVWDASGGIVIQPNGLSQVTVSWASQGIGQVCVQETNASGCAGNPVCLDVVIQPAVSGCTNNEACNYNPEANVDDNTCLFEGDPCDDGVLETVNDSIAPWCDCAGVLSVRELEHATDLNCFPNPADQSLTVSFTAVMAAEAILDVLDVQGRVCNRRAQHVSAGNNTILLDVEDLVSGCYSLRLSMFNTSKTVLFFKQ
jgi:hypothetical protein